MSTPVTKSRSRLLVLNNLVAFSLGHRESTGHCWNLHGHAFKPVRQPTVGRLVALQSAPIPNEWYLSWMVEHDPGEPGKRSERWLLESVETGKLCWWGNVGFYEYESETPACWRWTDRQHAFNHRWMRMDRLKDGYLHRPVPVIFGDGWTATIGTRVRFGYWGALPTFVVLDWRKTTTADLQRLHADCVVEAEAVKPLRLHR